MRIAISGAQNTGKSTLVKSFLYTWKSYETPSKTYRDVLKEKDLDHSSKTTTETQTAILDYFLDELQQHSSVDDNIVYDRCPLDTLVYTIWAHSKGLDGFDNDYVQKQIKLVRESMRFIDIIFVCKFDKTQHVVDDGFRDTDLEYLQEIDNIFESIYQQYFQNVHADVFFPKDDSPAVIKLPHSAQKRIDLIAEYVAPDGGMHSEEDSILNPENLNELEQLVKQQHAAHEAEEHEKELFKKFGLGNN